MAEQLFWSVLGHLQTSFRGFAYGQKGGTAWRFKRSIHIVDSTVIQLVASCMDWAKHRRLVAPLWDSTGRLAILGGSRPERPAWLEL